VYRVVPTGLVCDSVTNRPLVEWVDSCAGAPSAAKAYTFRVAPDCDNDGVNDNVQLQQIYGGHLLILARNGQKDSEPTNPIEAPPNTGTLPPGPGNGIDPGTGGGTGGGSGGGSGGGTGGGSGGGSGGGTGGGSGGGSGGGTGGGTTDPPQLPPPPVLTCVTACTLDINQDRVVNVQDIFDFLTLWFVNNPAADWNRSNSIETQDIFDYLNAWFANTRTDCTGQ
jgi:hypothetical protein